MTDSNSHKEDVQPAASVGNGKEGLYILMASVHGLVRGDNLELGRDADTGGQVLYVVELARALARQKGVARVDLLTRQIVDSRVSEDYAEPLEDIGDGAFIRRITCGPKRYLPKELLWDFMDVFVDQSLMHVRTVGRLPDVVHGHYADAGYVGREIARLLGRPFVFTGHSLGRVKRMHLRAKGMTDRQIENTYSISRRIEAEEMSLDTASMVVASTAQEVSEQYETYEYYAPERMRVIPPGVNMRRFGPPKKEDPEPVIAQELKRFLAEPQKPMILAISRADERKNIESLVHAYGQSKALQELANLVVIAGNRDSIKKLDKGARKVIQNIITLIDDYDLYGKVAYPKHHQSDDIPQLYRLATKTRGVFINPALTEPFGLTLIEAAASGVPVVATHDGGPNDIIGNCENGLLIDPLDVKAIANALETILGNDKKWDSYHANGLEGVARHYSWDSHASTYLKELNAVLERSFYQTQTYTRSSQRRLPLMDRIIITDIDNTLIGDDKGVDRFRDFLKNLGDNVGFAVATGRRLEEAIKVFDECDLPKPDIFITSVGAEIHYGVDLVKDVTWSKHLNYYWNPAAIRKALSKLEGLELQPEECQREHKVSYFIRKDGPDRAAIVKALRNEKLKAHVIVSHGDLVDVLSIRASKGLAVRYVSFKWGIAPERTLVAGDSGNDREMLRGNTLGVVVGNYSKELENLKNQPRIYFAEGNCANGILEGIDYYNFLGEVTPHDEAIDETQNDPEDHE